MAGEQAAVARATAAVFVDGRRAGSAVLVGPRYLVTAAHVLQRQDPRTLARVAVDQVELEFPDSGPGGQPGRVAAARGWFQPGGEATLAVGPYDRVGVPVRHIRGDARHREYSDRRGDANKPVDSVSHGHVAAIGELRGSGKRRHRPASVACLVE